MHITPCCNLPINTPHLNFFVSRKKRYTRSCIPRFEKRKMEKKCIKQCRVLLRGLSSSNSLSLHCSLISCPDFLIVAMSSRLLFSLLTTRQQKNLTKIPSISPVFFQVFILCIEIKNLSPLAFWASSNNVWYPMSLHCTAAPCFSLCLFSLQAKKLRSSLFSPWIMPLESAHSMTNNNKQPFLIS